MRSFVVQLPKSLIVDVYDLPIDFEERVQKAFEEFTTGTSKDYMFMDKLRFIDLASYYLHGGESDGENVKRLIHDKLDYELDEFGTFPDETDYLSVEFMEICYREARYNQQLHSDTYRGVESYKDREQIEKMLLRFIKAVIDFRGDEA